MALHHGLRPVRQQLDCYMLLHLWFQASYQGTSLGLCSSAHTYIETLCLQVCTASQTSYVLKKKGHRGMTDIHTQRKPRSACRGNPLATDSKGPGTHVFIRQSSDRAKISCAYYTRALCDACTQSSSNQHKSILTSSLLDFAPLRSRGMRRSVTWA